MKRAAHLYEQMCDRDIIRQAIIMASKRKRGRRTVRKVLANIDEYVEKVRTLLVTETFEPTPCSHFTIKDGATKKERDIACPRFYPDQIVHWVIILVCQPFLTRGMYQFCCGSVPGRGAHYGKRYIEKWMERDHKHTKYCLKLDIHKFYPSVKREVVMRELRKIIKCPKTLALFDKILSAEPGLPIGFYTSQWLANYVLQGLDHYIKEELKIAHYVRYMDDMVLLDSSKRRLHKTRKAISEFLAGLEQELKGNWQVFPVDARGIDFLGFRFFRDKTILRKNISLRLRRRIKKVARKEKPGRKDAAAVVSYLGWLKHVNCRTFYMAHVKPYLNIRKLKEAISDESKKYNRAYCLCG